MYPRLLRRIQAVLIDSLITPIVLFSCVFFVGKLFIDNGVVKGLLSLGPKLTEQAIYEIVRKRWRQASIPPVSPHDFRKTFISSLLDKGVDVFTVQRMAGHSDPQTTSGYDLRPEEDARTASEFLHLPYQRR